MANKSNLRSRFNVLTQSGLNWLVEKYDITPRSTLFFQKRILLFIPLHLGRFHYTLGFLPIKPSGLAKLSHFESSCRALGSDLDSDVFQAFYKLNQTRYWYTFEVRDKNATCFAWITTSMKDWKDHFFLIGDRCVPVEMVWKSRRPTLSGALLEDFSYDKILYTSLIREAGRIQKLSKHILVMGKISTMWPEPDYFPMIRWNGAVNVSTIRSASVVVNDKGKSLAVDGAQGSQEGGSVGKVILYGSEHLSVEDESPLDEGVEATFQTKESLKRRRKQTSKSDPNPQEFKRPKFVSVSRQEVIPEDDLGRRPAFSASRGLLENLAAHLTEGKLSRDQSYATLSP
ncbi:hypothetical protein Hanom_Chr15g01368151 [Helianthus anomalus]